MMKLTGRDSIPLGSARKDDGMSEATSEGADVDGATSAADGDGTPPSSTEIVRGGIRYAIFAVLLTLVALWFLDAQRNLVGYLILAGLLALALEPAVIWMHERHGWRRGSATALLLVGVLVALMLLVVGVGAVLARETTLIVHNLPAYIDKLNAFAQDHFNFVPFSAAQRDAAVHASIHVQDFLKQHQADILGGIASGVSGIFTLFTVGLFTFYLTAQGPQVRRALCSRMPPERQERLLFALETAIKKMGGYLYSRLLLAAINALLMFVTLKVLGVPFALPLAVISGLIAEFIPIVGTYIGAALPILVALAEQGPTAGIVVLIEAIVYQQIENYYLSPRISAKTIELNAGVAFGAAMAGGAVGGFVGAFFALPIAATVQAFLSTYAKSYEVEESALTHVDAPPAPAPPKTTGRPRRHRSTRAPADPPDSGLEESDPG
jgi:predicted PurR-regulated permease PerM